MTVNALMTMLIVFKIIKVFWEVNNTSIIQSGTHNLLQRVMFIIIESGMALFSIQLAWLIETHFCSVLSHFPLCHTLCPCYPSHTPVLLPVTCFYTCYLSLHHTSNPKLGHLILGMRMQHISWSQVLDPHPRNFCSPSIPRVPQFCSVLLFQISCACPEIFWSTISLT